MLKLSDKQKEVIAIIKEKGVYKTQDGQNKTVQVLINKLGVCEWNSAWTGLVLSEKGKALNL